MGNDDLDAKLTETARSVLWGEGKMPNNAIAEAAMLLCGSHPELSRQLTELASQHYERDHDDFRDRLTGELNQLHERLNKLEIFMNTAQFDSLSDIERSALREQYGHMRAYFTVLSGRVARLCGTP